MFIIFSLEKSFLWIDERILLLLSFEYQFKGDTANLNYKKRLYGICITWQSRQKSNQTKFENSNDEVTEKVQPIDASILNFPERSLNFGSERI